MKQVKSNALRNFSTLLMSEVFHCYGNKAFYCYFNNGISHHDEDKSGCMSNTYIKCHKVKTNTKIFWRIRDKQIFIVTVSDIFFAENNSKWDKKTKNP